MLCHVDLYTIADVAESHSIFLCGITQAKKSPLNCTQTWMHYIPSEGLYLFMN